MDRSKNIIRVEKNKDYTVINNTSLYDERLSWKAKAIHVFMLSKPDNWTFYYEEMMQWAKDGKDSFISGMNELKKYGYVKKEQRRGSNGKFDWVTVVYEVSQEGLVEQPKDVKQPSTEKPSMENTPMEQPYTDSPYMEKPSTEKPAMEKPSMENPQLISTYTLNTDSLNTNTPNTNITNQPNLSKAKNLLLQDDGWGKVVAFYHQNIHPMPAPFIYEKLGMMYDVHPIAELAIEALQIAVLNHAKNAIHYAETILLRWKSQNITTVEHARFEQQKQQQQNAKPYAQKAQRAERIPDWFYKRNEHAAASGDHAPSIPTDNEAIDFEVERQKILAKLGKA